MSFFVYGFYLPRSFYVIVPSNNLFCISTLLLVLLFLSGVRLYLPSSTVSLALDKSTHRSIVNKSSHSDTDAMKEICKSLVIASTILQIRVKQKFPTIGIGIPNLRFA
jgi:hypothetical protein